MENRIRNQELITFEKLKNFGDLILGGIVTSAFFLIILFVSWIIAGR